MHEPRARRARARLERGGLGRRARRRQRPPRLAPHEGRAPRPRRARRRASGQRRRGALRRADRLQRERPDDHGGLAPGTRGPPLGGAHPRGHERHRPGARRPSGVPDGVLPDHELRAAVRDGWIRAERPIADDQYQPASLDLRLGPSAYQLRASFLPFRQAVQSRLEERDLSDSDLVIDRLSLDSGATLQRGSVYLVPLLESLHLPPHVRGRSNPKSRSSGPPATRTSWRRTAFTSSCPRSASACRRNSRLRWSSMTRAPGRSAPTTLASSTRASASATGPFWARRWLWK